MKESVLYVSPLLNYTGNLITPKRQANEQGETEVAHTIDPICLFQQLEQLQQALFPCAARATLVAPM
jgi:hypothetical protein